MDSVVTPVADTARIRHHVGVAMDFDGTITSRDCLLMILQRHVADWPRLARAIHDGRLTEVQAIERALQLVRLPRDRLITEFVEAAELRPGFGGILGSLRACGARVAVVSAGFRDGIEAVWRREDLPAVPLYAAGLRGDAEHGFELDFDRRFGDCPLCGRGRCKGALVRSLRQEGDLVVAVGDGGRDLCMAREADLVFARGRLARLCEREGIQSRPFADFTEMGGELAAWLRTRP
jgi:2-hydroxy-3-keto-5-methylthiopentenyl-1-phosphate phosphatase